MFLKLTHILTLTCLFLLTASAHAVSSSEFKSKRAQIQELLVLESILKCETSEGDDKKFKTCVHQYLDPQLSDYAKNRIALWLFQSGELTNLERCKKKPVVDWNTGGRQLSFVCYSMTTKDHRKNSGAIAFTHQGKDTFIANIHMPAELVK